MKNVEKTQVKNALNALAAIVASPTIIRTSRNCFLVYCGNSACCIGLPFGSIVSAHVTGTSVFILMSNDIRVAFHRFRKVEISKPYTGKL